ncbi:ATP-binding cassette domain-containing protein [Modestobacter sp. I12A-02628]|uniref:ABC transporter ATP-binding protein n=1 Tax=Goekera deserti TaxID=2497753 RepID=A0A7K3WIN7_9ACTN|nr:ABC transporter ATP-binding protein [Goekera deserti]MPQ96697.1 ATP-binding cassette domain-containing protein [Goekera deserti]NDI46989.1 ATP-binding cassette domain-containing protein [Goekera deserti]NEL56226.1 ABC transporter ATP-binding protein [Goekera deserti]
MTSSALTLSGVSHSYGRTQALRDVSLSVAPGEVVAVTGPSGCGKSTLLLIAAGVLRAQSGRVTVAGTDLSGADDTARALVRRRSVGLVLQFGQLVPDLPVLDNVALPLLLEGHPPADARAAAAGWLDRVGLAVGPATLPAELSGGQTQLAAAARALVHGPALLLADEPTASLDTRSGRALLELMVSTTVAAGGSVLLVTHDNTVAARADREVRLRDGVIEHEVALS